MDKNIFVKKYNPDVNVKFTDRKISEKDFQKDSIEYKKDLWKGITGEKFSIDVSKPEDFIIEFPKPDFNLIRADYSDRYSQREIEKKEAEEKMKKIRQAAMQNVMKIQLDLGLEEQPVEIKTHNELKQLQLQLDDQDLLKDDKIKFNELVNSLEGLI